MNALRIALCPLLLLIATVPLTAQGTYTQIDDPNAVGATYCVGVNSAGDVVGYYSDANGFAHGFLLSGGVYTTIDYPRSSGTQLTGINDNGQIVGNSSSNPVVGSCTTSRAKPLARSAIPTRDTHFPMPSIMQAWS